MALVRISQQLVSEIEERIRAIGAREFASTVAPFAPTKQKPMCDIVRDYAEKKAWEAKPELRALMPAHWCTKTPRADVTFFDGDKNYPELQFGTDVVLPPGTQTGYGYFDLRRVSLSEMPLDFQIAVRDYYAKREAHENKYKTVRAQIVSFLNSCKSLNDAVKKLPNILLYVPEEYKSRLEKKVTRTGPVEKEEDSTPVVDTALIASVGVLGAIHGT